jgi:uncharacterized protein
LGTERDSRGARWKPDVTIPIEATPLAQQELDRLELLLDADMFRGESMPLDAMQGLFFAIASARDLVVPSRWIPVALGEHPEYANPEQAQEVLELVMRFYNQCVRAAAAGDFTLLVYESERGKDDLETWCSGYLEGVDLAVPSWYEAGDPDEVDELLFPFIVLAGELPEKERRQFKPAEWRKLVHSCEEAIGDAIVEVREYWTVLRNPPKSVRRESPKTGRNDPCPCGSGKKFKQCCGAPERLH